jgi:hypothetical protein
MFMAEPAEPLLSFPSLPEGNGGRYTTEDLALRPFGYYESDLNVDFNEPRRPFLVTGILECCTRAVDGGRVRPEFIWALTVGKRIECLLTLAMATGSDISCTLGCANRECGAALELEIAVDEVAAIQREAYASEPIELQVAHGQVTLRRPTANDQRNWLQTRFADEAAARAGIVRTLVIAEPNQPTEVANSTELISAMESALDARDPLVNFSLTVKCSVCGTESLLALDLEEISLQRLRQAQLRLLASVHTLAATYHWSEPQIFNVPYWRRARYLSLIEKGKNQ